MPSIDIRLGSKNLVLTYEEGDEGFIEINSKEDNMSLHIREEDDMLLALNFIDGADDPAYQADLLTGEVYLD
ncbi:hypothetical protein BH24DEI2_BH24DEI2_27000 [soil metagenome]